MSETVEQGAATDDSTFKPDPPKKASFFQAAALFIYHIVLALLLAYAVYNVWPPQPWPSDPKSTANANRANSNSAAGANSNRQVTTPADPATNTNTNVGGGVNANSAPGANTNSVATGRTDAGAAADTNAGSAARTNAGARPAGASAGDAAEAEMNPYGDEFPPPFWLFRRKFQPSLETRLLLLVLLAGAIGSYVHAASSFVDYLGNRTFISSWVWWYLLRPFIGMMLALIFYFVFRGGFVTAGVNQGGDAAASFINPFGVAALAGLVGMFSKVATDKLNEVFTTLFRPASGQGDAKRGDKLNASLPPAVTAVTPSGGPIAGGTPVKITGTGFMEGAKVTFGAVEATAVVVGSPTTLTAVTPAHAAGIVEVEVINTNNQKGVLKGGFTYQ
jgi:IPT/TIG domain